MWLSAISVTDRQFFGFPTTFWYWQEVIWFSVHVKSSELSVGMGNPDRELHTPVGDYDRNIVTRGLDVVRKFVHLQFMELSGGVTVTEAERVVAGITCFGRRERVRNSSETRKLFVDHYKGLLADPNVTFLSAAVAELTWITQLYLYVC